MPSIRTSTLAALLLLHTGLAAAAAVQAPHVEVELVAEHTGWIPGESNAVALRVAPEEGWHTYWRNPGDSGLPTRLQWTLPEGWDAGEIQWPYPSVEALGELTNYGYDRQTLHLVDLRLPASFPGGSATVRATAKWLVCKDICIPGEADLQLPLPIAADAGVDGRWIEAFADARARLPQDTVLAGGYQIADGEVRVDVAAGGQLEGVRRVQFFPYANDLVNHGAGQRVAIEDGAVRVAQAISPFHVPPQDAVEGLLVLHGATTRAFPVRADAATVPAVMPDRAPAATAGNAGGDTSLLLILSFAVLGGLILNLMPCVFPVLAIKAVAVLESHRNERLHALVYAAGVVLSCVAVAGLLLALRAGGQELGWGFQLQSPVFIGVLAYLLFALGLSLSGVVEFGTSLMGVGQSLTEKPGYSGSFFTGVLAVVVASPCTAPFMGTSLGFALTQPPPTALLIFAALGLGLALPFLLLGFFPVVGRLLPRPGPWMEAFRQAMAFPLYLTVVWLLWVLSRQVGGDGAAVAMAGLVVLAFSLWLLGRRAGGRWLGWVALVLAAATLLHPLLRVGSAPEPAALAEGRLAWSEARVAELRAQGRNVFVNFSADWCITCKANEKVALDSDAVAQAFAGRNVAWLEGDWTNADPQITRVLERFGRPGVPLYLLYPPTGEPEVLPQLLTPAIVIDAVDRLP